MLFAMRKPIKAVVATSVSAALLVAPVSAQAQDTVPIIPPGPSSVITSLPMPAHVLEPSAKPIPLADANRPLPVSYEFNGQQHTIDEYLARSLAQGFVVLDAASGQKIVHERYVVGGPKTLFQSWSMAKSFTSTAVGIALHEGHIDALDDRITKYLPELKGSGYDGVSIRNLLRMSSGIAWNEVVNAPEMHFRASAGTPVKSMAKERVRERAPGTAFNYTSMNSFVLAWLVTRTTGEPYYNYVERKIWRPAGMANIGYTGADFTESDLGYCCYYATDQDFARFGLLFLRGGKANGRQVVPASWIKLATTPSASFNQPPPGGLGYGLHWWLGDQDDYLASGLGGQFVYVSPKHKVVIAQSTVLSTVPAEESLAAFRAVAAHVARAR